MRDRDKRYIWLYAAMSAVMFAGMVIYSGFQEFWYDEVYQIGLVGSGTSLKDVIKNYAQLKDYTPPLYALISYFWVRLVPFSFRFLLLISEIMTSVGGFLTAMAAERAYGKRAGLLAGIFVMTSSVLVLASGYEFRAYSLYFMAAAMVLYFLAGRVSGTGKYNLVCYTLSLILLFYSHYYGSVVIGILFLIELFLVIVRKQKIVTIFPYIVSGLCFLPWMVLVLLNRTRSITEFWVQPPDLQSVFELINYLCSENDFLIAIFCLGMAVCIVHVVCRLKQKRFVYSQDAMMVYVPGIVLGVMAAVFLYSTVINPGGGIFLNRYFVGMLPFCFFIMAYGTLWLYKGFCSVLEKRDPQAFVVLAVSMFLFICIINGNTFMSGIKKEQTISYTSSVKELSKKEDIHDTDTIVVVSDNSCVRAGVEMYFERLFSTKAEVISQHDETFARDVIRYKKIYLFRGKQPLTEETKRILSEYKLVQKDHKNRITEYSGLGNDEQ